MNSPHAIRAGGALLLLSLLAFSVGCGGSTARATVKGKVTIGDKALTTGTVMFYGKNNTSSTATIDTNGEYVMADAPLGEVKISVSVPKPPPGGLEKMMGAAGLKKMKDAGKSVDPESGKTITIMGDVPANIVPIPDKYADPENSGLTYTVTRGEQTKNLSLTP